MRSKLVAAAIVTAVAGLVLAGCGSSVDNSGAKEDEVDGDAIGSIANLILTTIGDNTIPPSGIMNCHGEPVDTTLLLFFNGSPDDNNTVEFSVDDGASEQMVLRPGQDVSSNNPPNCSEIGGDGAYTDQFDQWTTITADNGQTVQVLPVAAWAGGGSLGTNSLEHKGNSFTVGAQGRQPWNMSINVKRSNHVFESFVINGTDIMQGIQYTGGGGETIYSVVDCQSAKSGTPQMIWPNYSEDGQGPGSLTYTTGQPICFWGPGA